MLISLFSCMATQNRRRRIRDFWPIKFLSKNINKIDDNWCLIQLSNTSSLFYPIYTVKIRVYKFATYNRAFFPFMPRVINFLPFIICFQFFTAYYSKSHPWRPTQGSALNWSFIFWRVTLVRKKEQAHRKSILPYWRRSRTWYTA